MNRPNRTRLLQILLGGIGASALFCLPQALALTRGPVQAEIHAIIIHAVSGPFCKGGRVAYSGAPGDAARWKRFFDRHPFLGIHYIVDRSGTVVSSTPENQMANHALGTNHGTIGIELVHNGDGEELFGDQQISALIELIRSIRSRHDIPLANIKSHAEVDNRTFECGGKPVKARVDPGSNFPWTRLRDELSRPVPSDSAGDGVSKSPLSPQSEPADPAEPQ
jgi:hypothetical protein